LSKLIWTNPPLVL